MKSFLQVVFTVAVSSVLLAPVPPSAHAGEQVVYSFGGSSGAFPEAGLINVKGTLYGTTVKGGSYDVCPQGCGTVFSLDPNTGIETILHAFCSLEGCSDGVRPVTPLLAAKGTLFGTTLAGGGSGCGGSGCGIVFSLDPATGSESVLHAFKGFPDGETPYGGLLRLNRKLYGTTSLGGANGYGMVFSINKRTVETAVYSFRIASGDGVNPMAGLIDVNGTLYGTTAAGGGRGRGTVFSLDPATGTLSVVYTFCSQTGCEDGQIPYADLVYVNGTLYGTTLYGGTGSCQDQCGTVFSLDPASGSETVLYSFQGASDGARPRAGLINVNGTLYGTTAAGGSGTCSGGCGTVYSVDITTGAETMLYSFQNDGADGTNPEAGLIAVGKALYGTTQAGGAYNLGTVFRITP